MDEICDLRNSASDIKAIKDVSSEMVKDNKRLLDEFQS